jgi:hypothetical protein
MHGEMALVSESGHGSNERRLYPAREQLARSAHTNLNEVSVRR